MLRIFQNITPVSLFFLLLYFAGLSIDVWIDPPEADFTAYTFITEKLLNDWTTLAHLSSTVLISISLASIFLQGIAVCYLMSAFKMIQKPSLIPAVMFYLFCFLFHDYGNFFPFLLFHFLNILLLIKLFSIYNKPKAIADIFDAGMLFSILLLLCFPALILIVFILIAIFNLRSSTFKEVSVLFIAFILIYFLAATVFYWYDVLPQFPDQFQLKIPVSINISSWGPVLIVKLFLAVILIFLSYIFVRAKYSSMLIQVRKYYKNLFIYLLFCVAMILTTGEPNIRSVFWAMLPASVFTGYYFIHLKNRDTAEILHLSFLGTVLIFQYINFV